MAIEYATVIGYGIFSFILIIAASVWETDNKEFLPLRVLLLLLGIFMAFKIPGTLNHFVYSNDYVNEGLLNATQIASLVKTNQSYSVMGTRIIYMICAYFAIWFAAFKLWDIGGKVYKEGIGEIEKGENQGLGKAKGGGKWQNPKW